AEDGIRDRTVTGVQTCALPILARALFGGSEGAIGNTLTVSGIPFLIVGVFEESVETFGQSEISDQTILIPYQVARYFQGTDSVRSEERRVGKEWRSRWSW